MPTVTSVTSTSSDVAGAIATTGTGLPTQTTSNVTVSSPSASLVPYTGAAVPINFDGMALTGLTVGVLAAFLLV